MAIINKNEFTKKIFHMLNGINGGSYSIGLHGISKSRCKDLTGKEDSEAVKDILDNGLSVYSNRTFAGTVYPCGRIDNKADIKNVDDSLKGYTYKDSDYYVIVAIPIFIQDEVYNTIYAGKTNLNSGYKKYFDTTGYEETSLVDKIVLINNEDGKQVIPSEFILGYYKRLPDGNIDFVDNPNHVSKRGGIVSDELFEKIDKNFDEALLKIEKLMDIFSEEELAYEDICNLEEFQNKYSEGIHKTIPTIQRMLAIILESIKQRLDENKIVKTTLEDINALNGQEKVKDYSRVYEGLEGEALFKKELEVLYDMKVDYFYTDDGSLAVHSDVPGEAEEFLRLFNDRGFIDRVFKYGNSFEIRNMALSMVAVTNDEILKDEEVYLKIVKWSYYALEELDQRKLLTRDMLVKCAETGSFNKDTLYKLPEEYSEDYDLICKFIDNSNVDNFGFYSPYGDSNLAYPVIGNDIRSNPEFYDKLNAKIDEINSSGDVYIPYFDKDNEIEIVRGRQR